MSSFVQRRRARDTYDCDGLSVSEENPQLDNRQASDPSNGEQANPFYADRSTKTKSSCSKPEPPARIEGLRWALLMLICKACPCQCCESCEGNQG